MSRLTARIAAAVLTAFFVAGCASAPPPPPFEQALAASANQGNPRAQYTLGMRILARSRAPADRAVGVAWVRRAAEANLASAQNRLGWMYLTGNDVPQNTTTALEWLHRAAERGAPAAQLQLGQLYAAGILLPADKSKAYYWYSVAAKPARSDVTIFNIEQVHFFARRRAQALATSLTPAERASVDRQVAAWATTSSVPYSGTVLLGRFMPLRPPVSRRQ